MTSSTSILGTTVRRVEDPALITGQSTFIDGRQEQGLLHAAFVRSPFPHAVIEGIDTSEAESSPGVRAVYTGASLGEAPYPDAMTTNKAAVRSLLARDRVRYAGEAVALVIADSREAATDAVELVEVDYEPLDAVSDMEAALAPDAPQLYEEIPGNVAGARTDDMSDPWPADATVVRVRMENQRVAAAPMEPRAVVAVPEADGSLTIHLGSQAPHTARDIAAGYLGLDKEKVRVVAPHVGGGFGGKIGISPEELAVTVAATKLGVPVKWNELRSEAMLSMQGRAQVQYGELGVDGEGKILGLRARVIGDGGAYAGFGGSFVLNQTRLMSQAVYAIPDLRYAGISVVTNTPITMAFRGAGRPEATAMVERLLDVAADELGLAPEEIRRRNLIPKDAFPYQTLTGATYDIGDYQLALDKALEIADVAGAREEQRRRREAGETAQLGIGISTYVEITGFGGTEFGGVEVHPDGTATVRIGTVPHGQGHATTYAMIVSEELGIPIEQITCIEGDTAVVPKGVGTFGSRSMQIGGSSVQGAAVKVREKAVQLAAAHLEAAAEDIEIVEGGFGVRGVPNSRVGWSQLAEAAAERGESLAGTDEFLLTSATFPFGAHVSVVEVDTETGLVTPLRHIAVDDCGTVLNPSLVQGQQHGGLMQGIAQALYENFQFDAEGTPLTGSFADYCIPSAADTVQYETFNTQTPTPLNPLGAKGIGESATIGSTPAVQNAVIDAVSHLGVRHIDLPCTPERVWRAVRDARAGTLAEPWREPPAAFDRIGDQEAAG